MLNKINSFTQSNYSNNLPQGKNVAFGNKYCLLLEKDIEKSSFLEQVMTLALLKTFGPSLDEIKLALGKKHKFFNEKITKNKNMYSLFVFTGKEAESISKVVEGRRDFFMKRLAKERFKEENIIPVTRLKEVLDFVNKKLLPDLGVKDANHNALNIFSL